LKIAKITTVKTASSTENSNMLKRFAIYGLIGWSTEIAWTGLESLINGDLRLLGYSSIWMFFIYGCAVFMEPIHDTIAGWNWFFRGIVWLVIIWGMEYSSGLLLYLVLGVHPWLYTDRMAVDGLVTLAFAPAWFAAGLMFERIHRTLDAWHVA
jgi:hypothetical protein